MARKNFAATGSFIAEDRPRALDLLGFSSQLVFNTFHNGRLHDMEHDGDATSPTPPPVPTTGACSSSARSTRGSCPRCTSRWSTPSAPWPPPKRHLPRGRPRCWWPRAARRASLPATPTCSACGPRPRRPASPSCSTSEGRGPSSTRNYFVNGKPVPPDFHGGEENFRSVDYMGIPVPPAQTLATLIFDGVLEAFPDLHIGVIEQGAIWVPSWLRQMESAFEAFHRHEERLQALSLRPSDYVHRQCRFTPYPTEDVGWIVDQAGADLVHVLVGLPARGGRAQAAGALRGVARRRRRRRAPTVLRRQLPLPHGERGRDPGGVTVRTRL